MAPEEWRRCTWGGGASIGNFVLKCVNVEQVWKFVWLFNKLTHHIWELYPVSAPPCCTKSVSTQLISLSVVFLCFLSGIHCTLWSYMFCFTFTASDKYRSCSLFISIICWITAALLLIDYDTKIISCVCYTQSKARRGNNYSHLTRLPISPEL